MQTLRNEGCKEMIMRDGRRDTGGRGGDVGENK